MPGSSGYLGLGADRTQVLLDVLTLHGRWLQEANDDARRAVRFGSLPSYLVDYEILFTYAFSAQRQPEAASGISFLLDHSDTQLWVGPGTALEMLEEIERRLRSREYAKTLRRVWRAFERGARGEELSGPLTSVMSSVSDALTSDLEVASGGFGLYMLTDLMRTGRLNMFTMTAADLDLTLVSNLAASLDLLRPRFTRSNFADALNYAAVLSSREVADEHGPTLFLLTNSQPLFNERLLPTTGQIRHPISRDVSTALYSALAFSHAESPLDLVERTLEHSLNAASLRTTLIREELNSDYYSPVDEDSLLHAAATNELTPDTRSALTELAQLLSDPIVLHAQDIFDDLQIVETNMAKQRGEFDGTVRSTSRLFDFLIDLGRIIEAGVTAIEDAADVALVVNTMEHLGFVEHRIYLRELDSSGPAATVEIHADPDGGSQFVINWPGAQDSELILDAFNDAYSRHDTSTVVGIFGFESDAEAWRVELPLTIDDLSKLANDERGVVWWLRIDCPGLFSLFADLVADEASLTSMIVGVGGRDLDADHVCDLHSRTSSRYLRPEWLLATLERLGV